MSLQLVHRSELRAPWGLLEKNQDHAILNTYQGNHGVIVCSGTKREMESALKRLDTPERHMPRRRILVMTPGETWEKNRIAHCEALRTSGELRVHVSVGLIPSFVILEPVASPADYVRACDLAQEILTGNRPARSAPALELRVPSLEASFLEAQIVESGNKFWLAWLADGKTSHDRKGFDTEDLAIEALLELACWLTPGPEGDHWRGCAAKAKAGEPYRLTDSGTLYYVPGMSDSTDRKMLGFGGRIFICTAPDGSEERSNNVSDCGTVPPPYRALFGTGRYVIQEEAIVRKVAA